MKCDWCKDEVDELYKMKYKSGDFEELGVDEVNLCKRCRVKFKNLMFLSTYGNLGNKEDNAGGKT